MVSTLSTYISTLKLWSWRFSRYSAPIHWLVHSHMTSNNETVSRQLPRTGNIAKTMRSNGKQFTVTREMLTAIARDRKWPDVVAGISARFSKFAIRLVLLYNKRNDWPLGNSEFCFPQLSMFPSTSSWKTLGFLGKNIHCSPRDQLLSVNYPPSLILFSPSRLLVIGISYCSTCLM